jgi:DNA polymerase-4
MRSIFLHIDYNSYFATVEQQANPRLRGKPIAVTGGDRMERTVVGAASIEAKALGVGTGMPIFEAIRVCPQLILVRGDSDKYLACTKRFINILKDYSPLLEIFSIDEAFVELRFPTGIPTFERGYKKKVLVNKSSHVAVNGGYESCGIEEKDFDDVAWNYAIQIATEIKERIRQEIGEWIRVSIGISYNKTLSKLAGSRQKPDGLQIIADETAAMMVLDQIPFDDICGIGPRTKKHLFNMGICDFPTLRKVPLSILLAAFKSYGNFLYNIARGENYDLLIPFYEKEEVKSVGHQHTLSRDTNDIFELQQILLKMSEMVAKRLRDKNLIGKTVVCFFRSAYNEEFFQTTGHRFYSNGMQTTVIPTGDGLEIFKAAWSSFIKMWDKENVRLLGVSVSNVQNKYESTLSLLPEVHRTEKITEVLDHVNDRFGDFTLRRGTLLGASGFRRKPNPFMSDRRFKI